MARPPKPTNLLKLQGTFRPDRHASRAAEPTVEGEPDPPAWLDGEAREFWDLLVPQLVDAGIATSLDSWALAGLCRHWANWRCEQRRYEAGEGHVYAVGSAWGCFDKMAARFGLTPTDRAKLQTPAREETSAFMDLLSKGG